MNYYNFILFLLWKKVDHLINIFSLAILLLVNLNKFYLTKVNLAISLKIFHLE